MVDYSKWKNIEVSMFSDLMKVTNFFLKISDDEDDTHPNIDTPSLFRWRHRARVERMEERKKEIEEFEKKKSDKLQKYKNFKEKLSEAEKSQSPNLEELKNALKEIEKEKEAMEKEEVELKKKDKVFNVLTSLHSQIFTYVQTSTFTVHSIYGLYLQCLKS